MGLADSPAGQLVWIVEKFHGWTDPQDRLENSVSREELLDNVVLYWLTNSGVRSAWLCWESLSWTPLLDKYFIPIQGSVLLRAYRLRNASSTSPIAYLQCPRSLTDTGFSRPRFA